MNSINNLLRQIIKDKQTNLCLAADVSDRERLLKLARELGPYICVLKTHIDIVSDFDQSLTEELKALSAKHRFLLFEDRKFADIGNTVKQQYAQGIYRIAEWADLVNAHILPGPGVIKGLQEVGQPLGRGLLLLAQMSSSDNLLTEEYTRQAVKMAKEHKDFVAGFIAQEKLDDEFITMVPGVKLSAGGDSLGQQYNTPEYVIKEKGADVIIVGRGIYEADDPVGQAERYRKIAWQAYSERALS